MKNSIELKEMRSDLISKLEVMKEVATNEERDLTTEENTEMDSVLEEVDVLDKKITRAEKVEKSIRDSALVAGVKVNDNIKDSKEVRDYSFQDAMRSAYTGEVSGLVKEMDQEARSQSVYTGQTFRGLAIPSCVLETRAQVGASAVNATEVMSFTDQLEANLVLASAGANFYSGVNNMKFPVISAVNSAFMPESGGTAAAANGTASSLTLSPKKLISVVNVSNEALMQNASLEAALRRNMAGSIAATLENALLNGGSDVTNAPASIFTDAAAASTAAFSGSTAITLETTCLDNGTKLEGARMAYLMNSTAYAAIKTAAQVSNVSPSYDNRTKEVNGYYSFMSSNVGADGTSASTKAFVLFGDFSKVHIAQFGGLDILFDPYTGGATGEPRMIVTSLVDGDAVQNSTAFANLIEA
jgi:HK97 family phage major capsid protein